MALVLHDYELSADAYKARLLVSILGLDCVKVPVDVFPGRETDGAAFRAVNPRGTVPVLVDGDIVIRSPEAILAHLAARHDPSGRWLPRDAAGYAATLDWLAFAAHDLKAADEARLEEMLGLPPTVADPLGGTRRAYRILDDHLVRQSFDGLPFLVGDTPTVADIACFPAVVLSIEFGCALEEYPKLRSWTRRIRALPGFVAMPGVPEFL
ncbi:glutathione S-transferase family protein [Chthonobacter albigriseus]|uniref:glutathione S-transferase family protein n=1 Tax=Chthonobacter albigriseus TaxID=1683161 RepID=UPI0015EE479C|nr:glutathione S-transferase family protein [Chthonobacter albigriseus]